MKFAIKTRIKINAQQRGVALVIVLWIIILLCLIASSFVYTMRTDVAIVSNSTSSAKARAIADAAVNRALLEMFKPIQEPDRWNADGVDHVWSFNEATVHVSMLDESGKIDINTAPEAMLRGLFFAQGLGEDETNALVDAVLDWRDVDALKRLHGAEEADYKAAGLSYKPANAPFQAIEELQLVLGMNAALYRGLVPSITIYSRLPGLNSQIAKRETMLAFPNVTPALVDEYLQLREAARASKQPIPLFAAASQYLSIGSGLIVSIRGEVRMTDGTVFVRDAVAIKLANPNRPYTFLAWKEGLASTQSNSSNTAETLGK